MDDFPKLTHKAEMLVEGDRHISEIENQYAEGLLTQNERHNKIIEVWTEIKEKIVAGNRDVLDKYGPVFAMIESGARGSWGQLAQVIGMKGLVSSPSGDIIELPVKGSFKEGFDVLEFFISSHGVRKGLSDTALRTANAGYLTRRLVDVAQDVVVLEDDCGENAGVMITRADSDQIGEKITERVLGRFALADVYVPQEGKGKKEIITAAGEIINEAACRAIDVHKVDNILVRTVLKCKMPKGICAKCYGWDLGHNKPVRLGQAVGIIAAQSIGEPGTQLTMRTFHTGGVAGTDITKGLPRVEELFEARMPKKKAIMADVSGQVEVLSADGRIIESPTGRRIFEGRRGQKIVKLRFEGVDEERYRLEEGDVAYIKDGKKIKKGAKLMTRASGEVIEAQHAGVAKVDDVAVRVVFEGGNEKEYIIPIGYKVIVKDGDLVTQGDCLTEGHVELQQLHELKGKEAVQTYILKEIQDIYSSQGQKLNDKHVEIILRQMFSRVYVTEAGDTEMIPGEIVEKSQLSDANVKIKKSEKNALGRELFLGVSKVSLSTQSFLSAASFQDTARVLIGAAITGKTDYLEGLKENVIIGRLIPAGTGYEERMAAAQGLGGSVTAAEAAATVRNGAAAANAEAAE
jgi:DNA-directed RNA polymerase subunit beta'